MTKAGHFPSFPIMPGVLIIEGLAQTAGALCVSNFDATYKPQLVYFMGIDRAKFRKPVVPGDTVYAAVELVRARGKVGWVRGVARVDDQIVAEADIMFALVKPTQESAL